MNKVYIARIDPTQYSIKEFYPAALKRCYCVGEIYEDGISISNDGSGVVRMELNLVDLFSNPSGKPFTLIIKTDTEILILPRTFYLGCVIDKIGYTATFENFPARDCDKIPIPHKVIRCDELEFNLSRQQSDELNTTINFDSTKSNPNPITFNVSIDVDKWMQDIEKWLKEKSHHATLSLLEQFAKETLRFKISTINETNPQSDTAQSVQQEKVE